jgi:hypothetical protein
MAMLDALNFGPGGALRFSRNQGRSLTGEALGAIRYPSPFFDIAQTYLPSSFKTMLRWCRYYFLTNPLINAVCYKMAEYPVTDLIFDATSPNDNSRWRKFFSEVLHYKKFEMEVGLDYNCLSGDTLVTTKDGVFSIKDLAGKTVEVLSEGGIYRSATFQSYGHQELLEVAFSRGETLYATEDHMWPVVDTNQKLKKVTTKELVGKYLIRNTAPRSERNEDYWNGVRHGIIFGDGTLSNEGKQAHICIYDPRKRTLAKYFDGYTVTPHHEDKYLGIYGLPPHYKSIPDQDSSASYWYGFTCGLLATDGGVTEDSGEVVLTQKDPDVLDEVKKRLPWLGLLGGQVREGLCLGYNKDPVLMHYLSLKKSFMVPEDFIREDQKEAFERGYNGPAYGRKAEVSSVRETGRWEEVFCCVEKETHTFTIGQGILTGNCYGNAFISISFPFHKLLICKKCRHAKDVTKQKYIFREYKFVGECECCRYHGEFDVRDHYVQSPRQIRLIRWNPEYITIEHNEATDSSRYYYVIPPSLANDVRMAKRHVIETVPQSFIEALRQNKALLFSQSNIYHMARPTIAQKDRGWGLPMILPVLKDTFYLQVLRKAQEAIAIEHVVPLRLLFPQTASSSADVYCVSHETLIETRNGPRAAFEVKVGDYLKSHTGAWDRVSFVKDRPVEAGEKVYRFKIASLPAFPFEVSEEHPILASKKAAFSYGYDGLAEPDWVHAKDLRKGDFVLYPTTRKTWTSLVLDLAEYIPDRAATDSYIYRRLNQASAEIYEYLESRDGVQHNRGEREQLLKERGWSVSDYQNAYTVFSCQSCVDRISRYLPVTEDLAFLIGLYAAEGYLGSGSPCFALHANESWFRAEIDRIVEELGFRGGCSGTYDVTENGVTHNVHDVLLGAFLQSVCGSCAENKKLPRFILEAPEPIALAAARGLLGGDGCNFRTTTRRIGLSTTSMDLAVGLRSILMSVGLIPTSQYRVPKDEAISKLPNYQINVNGLQADDLAGLLGWDKLGWAKNKNTVRSQCGFIRDGYAYLRINEVEEAVEVDTVRGFQMEGDRSFCVVGVATHNSTINLSQWRDKVEQEIIRWRLDNNYIPILPVPMGQQTLGGDGRALMLSQEYRQWSEQIVSGMGAPVEFIFGGLSYSGSNVSLRMLENHFLDIKSFRLRLVTDFIMPGVGAFLGWEPVPCHYKRFRMADDLQRSALYLQYNQAGKISDRSLLEDTDWDSDKEMELIEHERKGVLESQRRQALSQAAIQGESQLIMSKYQTRAQKVMQEMMAPPTPSVSNVQTPAPEEVPQPAPEEIPAGPVLPPGQPQQGQDPVQQQLQSQLGQAPQGGYDLMIVANKVVGWLNQLPDNEKAHELTRMQMENPHLYSVILPMLQSTAGAERSSASMPLPEQKPPRRGPEAALV